MRRNLYSSVTTGNLVSPVLPGTNNQGVITLSYKYKAANWSANTVGTNPWGSFNVQYGPTATGPWTTLATVSQETQNGTCITKSHTFTPPAGNIFLKWDCFWTSGDYYINFDDISVSQAVPITCSGSPNAGTAAISVSSGCANTLFNLSATGTSGGSGITYQWQSSSTASGPWTNIGGATATNYAVTAGVAATTYYKLVTTCSGSGLSNSSSVVSYQVNTCTGSLTMTDSFGDGWNGGTMQLYVNGSLFQTTLVVLLQQELRKLLIFVYLRHQPIR